MQDPEARPESDQEMLSRLVAEYQQRLNVRHWTISVVLLPTEQMDKRSIGAEMEVNAVLLLGTVRIDVHVPRRYYAYLVAHELAHLLVYDVEQVLCRLPKTIRPLAKLWLHRAVDQFARALAGETRCPTETELLSRSVA